MNMPRGEARCPEGKGGAVGATLPPCDGIPEVTSNGYGILRDGNGLVVFRAAPAPAEGKT